MTSFWPGVGPQSAWTFAGFAWLPGNRLAVNQPWQTDIATLSCPHLDATINEGDVCAVQMTFEHASPPSPGGIQVSIKGGEWADLEFDEGESVSSAASATAGDGEGLRLRGGTTGGPASLIATVNGITVSVVDS